MTFRACESFANSILERGLYNIGGGRTNAVSIATLFDLMSEVSEFQASFNEIEGGEKPVPLNYVTDNSRIEQELEWSPEITLEDGLRTLFR